MGRGHPLQVLLFCFLSLPAFLLFSPFFSLRVSSFLLAELVMSWWVALVSGLLHWLLDYGLRCYKLGWDLDYLLGHSLCEETVSRS